MFIKSKGRNKVIFLFSFFFLLDLVMFVQTRDSAHSSESLGFVIFFLLFSSFFFDSFLYLLDSILCICICIIPHPFSWTLYYKLYACRFLVCSLFCCFILAFIPSLGAELILILLLHPRSLLSFHFLFLFDSFHYQTLSLHF